MVLAILIYFALVGCAIAFAENTKTGNRIAKWVLEKITNQKAKNFKIKCVIMWRLKGGDTMRKNLYMFRHGLGLTQQEMADKIGCSRATYSAIEKGKQNGRVQFWEDVKTAFNITDAKKGELMKKEEKKGI